MLSIYSKSNKTSSILYTITRLKTKNLNAYFCIIVRELDGKSEYFLIIHLNFYAYLIYIYFYYLMSYDVFHTQLFKGYSYFFLEIFVERQKTKYIPNITKHILITPRFCYGWYYHYFCPTSFSLHYFNTYYNYLKIKNTTIPNNNKNNLFSMFIVYWS